MKFLIEDIRTKFAEKGLKITPQRVVILEVICKLNNHPTAKNIIEYIRESLPNIATGTVYKVLKTLVENVLIKKLISDKDIMRYKGFIETHQHLYCSVCDFIENYKDEELNKLLQNHFKNKNTKGFKIEDIALQIRRTFNKY